MREVPSCLNRRYEALDNLVSELTAQHMDCMDSACTHDPEIKLLCNFWNILKEDPDCDISQAIQHRLSTQSESGSIFGKQRFSCYMATEQNAALQENGPAKESVEETPKNEGDMKCCTSREAAPNEKTMPLSKVLCSLKEAASYDQRCHVRLGNLIDTEKRLQEQIKYLEAKEKQGVEMLQQADCIWSCMEESYKDKIQESLERQKILMKQLKDVEKSTTKWRKNKKDLESQLKSLGKCQEEIKEKINQKTNDIKTINKEIEDFKKRIEANKKDSEKSKNSVAEKKTISDGKLAYLASQIRNLQEELKKEQTFKEEKEAEGNEYIREAREDLQRICKLLLMKKLEHEDLKAEKQALMLEINLLKDSSDQCRERCQTKQNSLDKEISKIDNEIDNFKLKCIKCHECVDTSDVRKFCGDCPRCQAERDCIYEDDHCIHDEMTDCVCQVVKQKFLDNVFDNMYTVLEKQAKTGPGKAVAEAVLDCLRRSRNGKLNPETRKILQEFILTTVKKNLNLTIVGGAVKTRCEMEPQMYEKLMACLKEVKPTRVPKTDAGTDVKGEPCKRWGGPRECHCNKGPNECICTKKAPPPPKEPGPCPINKDDEQDRCPFHKDNLCGPECSTRAKGRGPCGSLPDPNDLGDLAQYIPDPCQGPSCPYTKDMRAAQCVFGPEPMSSNQSFKTAMSSYDPLLFDRQITCKCGGPPVKPCPCQDVRSRPRQKIIEEVMGGYDVMPIEKISELDESWSTESNKRRKILEGCSTSTKLSMNHSSSFNIKSFEIKNTSKQSSSNQLPDSIASKSRNQNESYKDKINSVRNIKNMNSKDKNQKIISSIRNNQELNSLTYEVSSWHTLLGENLEKTINIPRKVKKIDKEILGRKLLKKVNKIIQSSIVTDGTNKNQNADLPMEWISVNSLINRITLACKSSDNSNETEQEIEVLHQSLDFENKSGKKVMCNFVGGEKTNMWHCDSKNDQEIPSKTTDSKQLKAKLAQNPILNSCWKEWEDVRRNSSGTPTFLQDDCTVHVKIKKVPSVLTDFISKSQHLAIGTEPLVKYRNKKKKVKDYENLERKCDKNINFQGYLTELKNTCSGDLFIELDVETLSRIKKRAKNNTYLPVSIKETDSGNYIIDFDTTESIYSESGKIILKQSCSGVMSLEVGKDIASSLYPYFRSSHSKSSVSIGIIQKKLPCDCEEEQLKNNIKSKSLVKNKQIQNEDPVKKVGNCIKNIERVQSKSEDKENKVMVVKSKPERCQSIEDLRSELRLNLGSQRPHIALKVQGENGALGTTQAEVVETSSGNIALSIKNEDLLSIGDLAAKCKEMPVLLKRLSDVYILYVQRKSLSKAPNTVLRRTISGDFLVVITEPVLSNTHPKELSGCTIKEKIFKIKVKGTQENIIEPPGILKLTSSENYMLVLDKEFENEHRSRLNHFENECFVELRKTDSNTVLINFDDSDSIHNKQNALLVRSSSGDMKILVNGPVFDTLSLNLTNLQKDPTTHALEKVLVQSKQTCKHKETKHYEKSLENVKSSSDSTLYKTELNSQTKNIDLNTVTLKRTDSGKYAILLQKNAKKNFINDLKRYLSTKHQGFVPIWKGTEFGEITIDLSSRENKDDQCGSLKITPSGNIFIIVEESFINTLSKTGSGQHYVMNNDLDFSPKSSLRISSPVKYLRSHMKSSSHCDLYEEAKCRLQNQMGLDGSSATVKKTDSGHYIVILNKESKQALINDLNNSLCKIPQDRIQFWKGTESGGITIDLNSVKNNKDNGGSLKISKSGNIYVTVNEKQLKNITKDIESNKALSSVADVVLKNILGSPRKTSFADSKCKYLLKTIKNKQTATNCKGKPDKDFCNQSKCVCSGNENINNKYDGMGTSAAIQTYSKTTPHIIIQPCGCQTSKQKCKSNDQFCYVMDSVCPIHKDRYENISNEILEITGTCKKTKHNKGKTKVKKVPTTKKFNEVKEDYTEGENLFWDSLSYLPRQLPPFLRDFQ